jgi:hypothetical protein
VQEEEEMGIRKLFRKEKDPSGMIDHGGRSPDVGHEHERLTLNDLTVNFRHLERETLLEDWQWLIGSTKQPIVLTACGDAFVQDVSDGTVHLLNVGEGKLQQIAESAEVFRSLLADRDFVVGFFGVQLVSELRASGCFLGDGQIYSFKTPPFLGGEYVASNMEPTAIEVHFSLFGAMHEQVAGLPEGTKIKGFTLGPA